MKLLFPPLSRYWWAVEGKARSLAGQALCRKELRDIKGAIVDMDEAIKLYAYVLAHCSYPKICIQEEVREDISSLAEEVAKWKKEQASNR